MTRLRRSITSLLLALPAGCAPSGATPDAVCQKLAQLATQEGGPARTAFDLRLGPSCVTELGSQRARMGDERWARATACILATASLTAAASCDGLQ